MLIAALEAHRGEREAVAGRDTGPLLRRLDQKLLRRDKDREPPVDRRVDLLGQQIRQQHAVGRHRDVNVGAARIRECMPPANCASPTEMGPAGFSVPLPETDFVAALFHPLRSKLIAAKVLSASSIGVRLLRSIVFVERQ